MTAPSQPHPALLLLEQTPDLLGTANAEGYFTWINAQWTVTLGWSREELCARPYVEFVHPEDVERTYAEAAGLFEDGSPTILFTNRYATKDGSYRWLEWNARVAPDGDVHFVARDITERLARDAEGRRTVEQLKLAEEVAQTGHWHVDLSTHELTWSDEVYRIHGLPKSFEPTLENGIDAYHPEDRQRVSDCVNAAIEEGSGFDFELRLVRPSGEIRLVHSVGRVLRHPETQAVSGLFGVFRDITDDERVRRMEELEQFAYVAGHDIKEPVRTIRSFLALIAETDGQEPPDPDRGEYWRFVDEASTRLERLITDLAAYTRAGREVALQRVDLADVAAGAQTDLSSRIASFNATVDVDELPAVLGEPVLLGVVFQNLIGNALKFHREGEAPRVEVTAGTEDGRVLVSFRDNGIGFEPRFAERIFRPFQRLHARDSYDGSGIGLALVQRMVRQCGGSVWAESAPGEGATFTVALRCA